MASDRREAVMAPLQEERQGRRCCGSDCSFGTPPCLFPACRQRHPPVLQAPTPGATKQRAQRRTRLSGGLIPRRFFLQNTETEYGRIGNPASVGLSSLRKKSCENPAPAFIIFNARQSNHGDRRPIGGEAFSAGDIEAPPGIGAPQRRSRRRVQRRGVRRAERTPQHANSRSRARLLDTCFPTTHPRWRLGFHCGGRQRMAPGAGPDHSLGASRCIDGSSEPDGVRREHLERALSRTHE